MSCFEVACSVNNVIIVWGSLPELLVSNLTYNWMSNVWSYNGLICLWSLTWCYQFDTLVTANAHLPPCCLLPVALTAQCPTLQSCFQRMYEVWRSLPAFASLSFNCLMLQIVPCLVPHPLFRTELVHHERENFPHDALSNLVFVSYA